MSEWIKCSDRLPDIEQRVLAISEESSEEENMHVGWREKDRFHEKGWYWTHYDYLEWYRVTHWMPLPQEPTEKATIIEEKP